MFGQIDALESAMVKTLAGRLSGMRFVGSYGGELVGDWQAVVRSVPACWVAFESMSEPKPLNVSRTRLEAWIKMVVVVASRSVQSESASRRGGHAQPGTYRMLADAAGLLCMQDFGLEGVDYLRPGPVRTLYSAQLQGQALSVMAQDWRARIVFLLREPGQRHLPLPGDDDSGPHGYLPPAPYGEPLPEMSGLGLRYWLKPPQDPAADDPMLADILPRPNINIFEAKR